MDQLVERLEKATGPSRELDGDIAELSGAVPYGRFLPGTFVRMKNHDSGEPIWWHRNYTSSQWIAPRYTSSIDAALTLMPELSAMQRPLKMIFAISESGKKFVVWLDNWMWGTIKSGDCPNYAIALCIAALKARNKIISQ